MRLPPVSTATVVAASLAAVAAETDNSKRCQNVAGNWYCRSVSAISYSNFGLPGTYNKTTSMANGKCVSSAFTYTGGMAPLDGEVSWHFRGPLHLKQFAYYIPGSNSPAKRNTPRYGHGHRQTHKSRRTHDAKDEEKNRILDNRSVGDMVTATINGQAVSWINQYSGPSLTASPSTITTVITKHSKTWSAPDSMVYATIDGQVVSWTNQYTLPPTTDIPTPTTFQNSLANAVSNTPSSSAEPLSISTASTSPDEWSRQAYYDAGSQMSQNIVFLNNKGGDASGVFDYTWGASLSYASSDTLSGSSSSEILSDILIPDNSEISLFTAVPCTTSSCGTFRPGTIAYHGFSGPSKLFLIEFSMPLTNKTGFNADMPAAWILNAEIPRTIQYGAKECSCFATGCGEWDIFEVLNSGNTRCKSTFHGARAGGASDYFDRPVDELVKVAVVFDEYTSSGHIIVLDSDIDFQELISGTQIANVMTKVKQQGGLMAFKLPNNPTPL